MNKEDIDNEFLRHLVDVVWNDVTESSEVPSTIHADMLIKKARETFKIVPEKPVKATRLAQELCEGCSHNKPMKDSVYCEDCRKEPV